MKISPTKDVLLDKKETIKFWNLFASIHHQDVETKLDTNKTIFGPSGQLSFVMTGLGRARIRVRVKVSVTWFFRFCDLDLDPMTFIYELDPY